MSELSFSYQQTIGLAVTTTSSSVLIPTTTPSSGPNPADTIVVQNIGSKECFIAFGQTLSVVAVAAGTSSNTNGMPIQPSLAVNYHFANNQQTTAIAAVCGGSDTTTLRISVGHGRL